MIELPILLRNAPLVDAIFEMRFKGDPALAEIFPGILYKKFKPNSRVTRLPLSGMPEEIRRQDPNLIYAPLVAVELDECTVSVSERSVVVSAKMPYSGWKNFKKNIEYIVKSAESSHFINEIERFSLKYTNIIEVSEGKSAMELTTAKIQIGDDTISDDYVNILVEKTENEFIRIKRILSSVAATLAHSSETRNGLLVESDTIINASPERPVAFGTIIDRLDELRLVNKQDFFAMLTADTVKSLGAEY